jgi:hypothetical protein
MVGYCQNSRSLSSILLRELLPFSLKFKNRHTKSQPTMLKMTSLSGLIVACFLVTTAAGKPTAPKCRDLTLRVPVTAVSYDLDIVHVSNNIEAVEFALDLDKWSSPNVTERIIGVTNISDTYSIYAQLCLPDSTQDKHVMQILSHGLAFDHRYCGLAWAAGRKEAGG